ncbi:MAG: tyrosine-type recombinase/integrase [Clostridia bacterium]|nr:tyrosine-type recombinase/integrase [Clostridia bacterium]
MSKIRLMKSVNSMTVEQAFQEFLESCKLKNLSKATLKNYDNQFKVFTQFFDDSQPVFCIDQQTVTAYTQYLQRKFSNAESINTSLRHLRSMLNYWCEQDYCQPSKIKLLKTETKIKDCYTDTELKVLLQKPDIKRCSFSEYRNWTVINVLVATGIRLRSLVNIKVGDVDFDNGFLKVTTTKNRKPQLLPLPQSMLTILKDYLKHRRGNPDDVLFCSEAGSKLLESSVNHSLCKYNRERGIEKTGVHLYRHTFARNFILSGGDVFRLQKQLGHSTLDVSKRYANLYDTDLKKDFEKFNLLERLQVQQQRIKMK